MAFMAERIKAEVLESIRRSLETVSGLGDPSLSGVQITVRLKPDKTVRAVIIEPELRFEGT